MIRRCCCYQEERKTNRVRGQSPAGCTEFDEPVSCVYGLQRRRDLWADEFGTDALRGAKRYRTRVVPSPMSVNAILISIGFMREYVVHGSRVRGVQGRGLGVNKHGVHGQNCNDVAQN